MSVPTPAISMGIQSLEERVLIALVRAAWIASSPSNSVVRRAGLSPSQYNVLRILARAGKDGLTRTAIGERMVTRDSDLTRILSGLTHMGAVTTRRSAKDRRSRVSRITYRGHAILDELDDLVRDAATSVLGGLKTADLKHLKRLLEAIGPAPAS